MLYHCLKSYLQFLSQSTVGFQQTSGFSRRGWGRRDFQGWDDQPGLYDAIFKNLTSVLYCTVIDVLPNEQIDELATGRLQQTH